MILRNITFVGASAAMTLIPVATLAAHPGNDFDHDPIFTRPIADIKTNHWFDYLSDVREAEHELIKDLRRATDAEDRRDAVSEYRAEITDANKDYSKEMRERGYRTGRVTIIGR